MKQSGCLVVVYKNQLLGQPNESHGDIFGILEINKSLKSPKALPASWLECLSQPGRTFAQA